MSTSQNIIKTHIFLMPFLSAFALTPYLPLPLLFMIGVVISSTLLGKLKYILSYFQNDFLLIILVLSGIFGMIFSQKYLGSKNLNHTLAISSSIFFFYFVVRNILISSNISWGQIGKISAVSLVFISTAIIIEFITANLFGFYLSDVIPYNYEALDNADVLEFFKRPRGLSTEPGFTAIFYEVALPLSFFYFKEKPRVFLISLPIILTGFVLLFSAASISSMFSSALITILVRKKNKYLLFFVIFVIIALCLVSFNPEIQWIFFQIIGRKGELLLTPTATSSSDYGSRNSVFQAAMSFFYSSPFGIGWGTIAQLNETGLSYADSIYWPNRGMVSLYAEILVASGFLGIISFLCFQFSKIIKMIYVNSIPSSIVLLTLLSSAFHYIFVSDFWFPMLWFPFALSDLVMYKYKTKDTSIL